MESGGDGGGFSPKGDRNRNNRRRLRHQFTSGVAPKITVMLMVIGITSLVHQSGYHTNLYQISYSFSDHKNQNLTSPFHQLITAKNSPASGKEEEMNYKLEEMLRKVVMKDKKTVIITTLNEAWAKPNSTFDIFLESFRIGNGTQKLLKHVMVCTMDSKAHSRCLQENLHCYALNSDDDDANFSGEALLMTDIYMKMIWARIDFLLTILQMGYDFVFTDADVMWFRNPFPRFKPNVDIQVSSDYFLSELRSKPNGGFKYVKSNNRSIEFYKFWIKGRKYYPWYHDQQVLNEIKISPFIPKIGLRLRFMKTVYFGGFCESSRDLNSVVTMHANCCIGLENKIPEMQSVIKDWKHYMTTHVQTNFTCPWSLPRLCTL